MKLKLNKKELLDGVIAAVTVENAPLILSKLGLPTAGMTGQLAGGVLAYIVGMLLKKPNVANVGIAVAVGNIVNDVAVTPLLNKVTGNSPVAPPMPQGANSSGLANYTRLRDYPNRLVSNRNYQMIYS